MKKETKPEPKKVSDSIKRVQKQIDKLYKLCNGLKVPLILRYMDEDGNVGGIWSYSHPTKSFGISGSILYSHLFSSFESEYSKLEVCLRDRETGEFLKK